MNWTLAFITPVNTPTGITRKLILEDENGERATLLAGPWGKMTKICKGFIDDGAPITAPIPLTVSKKETEHGPVLVPAGIRLVIVDPTVTTVKDKTGADGKVLRNISGGIIHLSTFALSAGDDEPALLGQAPVVDAGSDEPALS